MTYDADADIAIADLRTPAIARVGGGLLVAAGMFVVAASAQVILATEGPLATVAGAALTLTGMLSVAVAPHVYNGRGWAAITGTTLAVAMAALVLGWTAWALLATTFAPTLLLAGGATIMAVPVLPFAVGPSLKVSAARRAILA
ncbi:MAG: hypothetical protein H6738_18895 [Alphaproteobacteria bacterium]|nr:hypothetical protein [Alphaproteobacteria bacterium]MCB9698856.1 hypothetical protein [Alphaproteobacteria bacterium]